MPELEQPATEVHAYTRGAAQEEFPVTVKAPIITDGVTQEGVQPLLDFVESLKAHRNTEEAAAEAERLQPYFSALNIYLTRVLEDVSPENKETLKKLIAPGQLSGLFNAMAEYTHNTMLSDVVIMPSDIDKGPASSLFTTTYNPTFAYGAHPFSFGFLQVYEGGDKFKARSSTTIPTFTLDTQMMKDIAPHRPKELLHGFQNVVTVMNHDMLHHLHSPYINKTIFHKFIKGGGYDFNGDIIKWANALPGGGIRVEEWSQVSHGKVFMARGNEALIKETGASLDRYFNELARIAKALPKDKAHDVVDYFGTVMAQTLSRTFPFNHPLMTQCLDRMEKADPLSGKELLEKAIKKYGEITQYGSASLKDVRYEVAEFKQITNIIKGYRQQGLDILPDDDRAVSFKGLKMLQLARIETTEMRSHVPTPVGEMEQKVRADSDRAFLGLVGAVAKATGFCPATM